MLYVDEYVDVHAYVHMPIQTGLLYFGLRGVYSSDLSSNAGL